jgi:autotransporter-associated beta strand protein
LLAAANPDLPKQTAANFLSNANPSAGGTTITLDGSQSITTMTFDSANPYTIAPGTGGSLTLTGTNPSITVNQGSHYITSTLVLNANTSFNLIGNLTLSGNFITNGHTITKTDAGTLTIAGPQSNSTSSTIQVAGGTLNLNTDVGSSASPVLQIGVSGSGTVNFNSQQHLASLVLDAGNATDQTSGQHLLTHSFSIFNGSTFNLKNNDLIVDYTGTSPLAQIRSALLTGYNNGQWNGPGIISSSAAADPATALGYAEAADIFNLSGSETATFDGETVDATTALVKYTWVGDANLDGVVNAADLALMSPTGTTWSTGDFNYDGVVNADDYALLFLGLKISTTVPEPALAMSAIALMAFLPLRHRRH